MCNCSGAQLLGPPKPNQVKALKAPWRFPLTFNLSHRMISKRKRDLQLCGQIFHTLAYSDQRQTQLNGRKYILLPLIIKRIFVWNSGSMIITDDIQIFFFF